MICSKVHRILLKDQQQKQQELIAGITDYLPHSLRNSQNINISIVGNHDQIVNHVLWNEFFSKTFLKESYYFLLNHHSTQGHQTTTAVFLKKDGKVYKMEEILQWESPLRNQILLNRSQVKNLQIQSFSNKGNIRKISIFLSQYPVYKQNMTILLKVGSLQAPTAVTKNNNKVHYANEEIIMQQTDRINIKNQQQISKITLGSHSKHKTKVSELSANSQAKKSKRQKQNGKNSFITVSQKQPSLKNRTSSKKTVKQTVLKRLNDVESITPSSKISYQTRSILDYSTRPINRESVLSKIVTSKQEQIVLLKQELLQKQQEYEIMLRQVQQSHDKQVNKLTQDIKEVLDSYSKSQKEVLDQNLYLKDRVNVLQETLYKNNSTLERYSGEMEDYIAKIRGFEETNKKINEINRKMQQQINQNRQNYNSDRMKLQSEVNSWRQKAQQYRNKYQKVVDTMKIVLHQI